MADLITSIPAEKIRAGANDRTVFDPVALADLAESIKINGLAQPPTVRLMPDGMYQLIAGERRTRAMRDVLCWEMIPCRVIECDDSTASALMLAENTARADLDPIDEGNAYDKRLAAGETTASIAKVAGVSAQRVTARLKLVHHLRPELQKLVRDGQLTVGYAGIIADGELDTNRQMLAVRMLQQNDHPTPSWFRAQVSELVRQQAQGGFDFGLFSGECPLAPEQKKLPDPPHPSTHKPARRSSMAATLKYHCQFWVDAAQAWKKAGRVTKYHECLAAAQAQAAMFEALFGAKLEVAV